MGNEGAVILEALAVMSFFVVCLVTSKYVFELYLKQLHAMRLARAASLYHAMVNCVGDPLFAIEADRGTAVLVPDGVSGGDLSLKKDVSPASGHAKAALGGSKMSADITGFTVEDAVSVRSPQTSYASDVHSGDFVMCADSTDADVDDPFPEIFSRVKGAIPF